MILLYHKIGEFIHDYNNLGVSSENFKFQIEYLKKNFEIVPIEQENKNNIAITFDDGFEDFYSKAFPLLKTNGIPTTIFISTAQIGKTEELWTTELLRLIFTNWQHKSNLALLIEGDYYTFPTRSISELINMYHVLRYFCMKSEENFRKEILNTLRKWAKMGKEGRKEYRFLSEKELQELADSPLITIGAHTINHVSLGAFGYEEQKNEILGGKEILERIIGKEVFYFSYPFGTKENYNETTISIIKDLGFKAAYTTKGYNDNSNKFEHPRVAVPNLGGTDFVEWINNSMQKNDNKVALNNHKNIVFIGSLFEDRILFENEHQIAIFGAGVRGKNVYQVLAEHGKREQIKYFVDNNSYKQGQFLYNIEILSFEKFKECTPSAVIVNSMYDFQIINQLIDEEIENVHWII